MTFTETNNTGSTAFVNAGPSIDYFFVTSGGQTVWRSNSGISPQFIVHQELQPGQSITFTADWHLAVHSRYVRGSQ